jgi:inorganic triphosphatase YgiF
MGATDHHHPRTDEREVKLAVGEEFVLPALSSLGGATIVDRGDERLRAVYWDSDDLALAHAGVGLRHRNGVWTYKGRSRREGDAVVREEVERTAPGGSIPPDFLARVVRWADAATLHPVAALDTVRHHIDVTQGDSSAELVHDRVTILDGERVVGGFSEVEVEHDSASRDLAGRLVRLLVATGAVVDTTPKYVRALRALGHRPPEISM